MPKQVYRPGRGWEKQSGNANGLDKTRWYKRNICTNVLCDILPDGTVVIPKDEEVTIKANDNVGFHVLDHR